MGRTMFSANTCSCRRRALFRELSTKACGPDVAVVRAMFFNKPKEQGKAIDWHQDREGPNNLPSLGPGDGNIPICKHTNFNFHQLQCFGAPLTDCLR